MNDPFTDLYVGAMSPLDSFGSFDPSSGPALSVRFTDPAKLVEKEGGAAGSLAFMLGPQAIVSKIYEDAKKEIEKSFAERGIAADVKVVSGTGYKSHAWSNDLFTGMAIGAGGVGVGWLMWRYVIRGLFTTKKG